MEMISEQFTDDLISLGHVLIAAILGGIVGLEREKHQKPAGFRTHMVISSACALLIILGRMVIRDYVDAGVMEADNFRADPIRVIQSIIVGVSFIGAGTILKQTGSNQILYLTTAATILLSSSIGIAVALRQYVLSFGIVILVLIINYAVRKIDYAVGKSPADKDPKSE